MQRRASAPPRRPSPSYDDGENSSLTQVLSQRLTNMEQQLFLLKDDLKKAVGTLKQKDREIQNLQNRIALAERRRELEEAGKPVDESLKDVSGYVDSKSNSKLNKLDNEVVALAKKLEEMEKFFGDYGLAWVKEDALDEKDPNNLWIRKSNIHYTPDFEKVFLVVEELNLGNAEPQIVRKGNTAQFKTAQLLNLTLYADGIQLENNPFRKYDSPSVEEFFQDLEDGYFPTELKGSNPEGVIFKVRDKRTICFDDDPDKRPVISALTKPSAKAVLSPSSPISLSSLRAASQRSSKSSSPGSPGSSEGRVDKNGELGFFASSSRKRSSSKKALNRLSRVSGDVKQNNIPAVPKEKSSPTAGVPFGVDEKVPLSVPVLVEDLDQSGNPNDATATGEVAKPELSPEKPSGDAAVLEGNDGKVVDDISGGGGGMPGDTTPGTVIPAEQEKPNHEKGFKELFRGKTPSSSALQLPEQSVEPILGSQPKDAFGLPRPPFPSRSTTVADVRPLPLGPPSKQFENFSFPKTSETQTSLTLMPGVGQRTHTEPSAPCPQPTHVTNITYNEAPITIQMTPSEFVRTKSGADAANSPAMLEVPCPTHHPHPCNCVCTPRDPCASEGEPKEGIFGSVGLAKFPAETEYRERFTESAINSHNVLDLKKRSQEAKRPQSHSPSPTPVSRQPAATLLVGPDEAPIPPDPVPNNLIDPNVKWEHFTYLGHPKGQEPVVTPDVMSRSRPKKNPSPQVVQLNEKTSERMISVRMRTENGDKEYIANVLPEEPVKKLWSLLELNDKDYSLSPSETPHVPLKHGSIGEVSKGEDITLLITKNKGKNKGSSETRLKSRGSVNSLAASKKKNGVMKGLAKTMMEGSSISQDGSRITNISSISTSLDAHSSYNGLSEPDSLRSSSGIEAKSKQLSSRESSLGRGSMKNSSKSLKLKKSARESPSENQLSRESGGSQHSNISVKSGSTQPQETVRKVELVTEGSAQALKKPTSFQSAFPPEITPKSRAKGLSKHLSISSLHKTSFKGSSRKLEVIHETEPSMLEPPSPEVTIPSGLVSNVVNKRSNQVGEERAAPAEKRSNDSAEGIHTFVLPPDSHKDGKLPTKHPSQAQVVSVGDTLKQPLVEGSNQDREVPKFPVTIAEEENKIDPEQEPDYHAAANTKVQHTKVQNTKVQNTKVFARVAKSDATRAKDDGLPPGASVVTADPLSLQSSEQHLQPPSTFSNHVAHSKPSSGIDNLRNSKDGTKSSSQSVSKNTHANEDDIYSEMKNLVSSAILNLGVGNNGDNAADKHVANVPELGSSGQSVNETPRRRKKSSGDKPVQNREDWHPVEDPPSIRRSDVDLSLNETVEPQTAEPKKSYDTNDSEQLFERRQHPEAADSPTVEQAETELNGETHTKEELGKDKETSEKAVKQDGKKKKGESAKKNASEKGESANLDIDESANLDIDESANLDIDEAALGVKSGSGASVHSTDDADYGNIVDETEDENNTPV